MRERDRPRDDDPATHLILPECTEAEIEALYRLQDRVMAGATDVTEFTADDDEAWMLIANFTGDQQLMLQSMRTVLRERRESGVPAELLDGDVKSNGQQLAADIAYQTIYELRQEYPLSETGCEPLQTNDDPFSKN